jgi:catechol 2,3-dioxygenase-like lactoylglutathione lyase family enzyme
VIASVTVSVRSLAKVREFWVHVLGLQEVSDAEVHASRHEALWNLEGAVRDTLVLRTGDLAIEFVQYISPLGKPRPAGYLISDQGLLNVAFGSTVRADFEAVYHRALERGFEGNAKPWTLPGVATVVYLRDPQGLSVELLYVEPEALERMGFAAAPSRSS